MCPATTGRNPSVKAFLVAASAMLLATACTAVRTAVHNFADLDDYRIFPNRAVEPSAQPSRLRTVRRVPRFLEQLQVPDEKGRFHALDSYLGDTRTAAFIVLREDRIVYERYGRGFSEESLLNSFSIAKAMIGTLVGIALKEGKIASLDATVAEYRPDLAGTPYGSATVKSLLTMTSGIADRVSLLPGRAQYYYGDDLHEAIAGATRGSPGAWRYSEADVQVLGFVLEAAAGKSLSSYLSEKLWKPLGMESRALWAMDHEGGVEKAFCCISARARDFARFGRLYLQGGMWDGERLAPASWIERSELPGLRVKDGYTHRHLWWIPEGHQDDYYAYGHNGQYLYVNPAAKVVIVKFSETSRQDPLPMFRAVSAALQSPDRIAELDRLEASPVALR